MKNPPSRLNILVIELNKRKIFGKWGFDRIPCTVSLGVPRGAVGKPSF